MRRLGLALGAAALLATSVPPARAHVGDPETYRWVEPPAAVEATNEPPLDRHGALADAAGGPALIWTGDLQLTFTLDDPPIDAGDEIWVSIVATAPSMLPALPNDTQPVGNAYEITLRDGEDGPPLLGGRGTLQFTVPHEPTEILRLQPDGTWSAAPAVATQFGFTRSFDGSAVYLAVADHDASRSLPSWGVLGIWMGALAAGVAVLRRPRKRPRIQEDAGPVHADLGT